MRLSRILMRVGGVACAVAVAAHAAAAQKSAVAAWRSGFEVSVNGSGWSRSVAVALTRAQCPPSETSPCGSGSAVGVDMRFPAVAQAADLGRTRAALGESGGVRSEARYEVRVIRPQSSPLCPNGFTATTPANAARLAINLASAGPPLPLTCRWVALVGVADPSDPAKVTAIWSDTVSVLLTSKR